MEIQKLTFKGYTVKPYRCLTVNKQGIIDPFLEDKAKLELIFTTKEEARKYAQELASELALSLNNAEKRESVSVYGVFEDVDKDNVTCTTTSLRIKNSDNYNVVIVRFYVIEREYVVSEALTKNIFAALCAEKYETDVKKIIAEYKHTHNDDYYSSPESIAKIAKKSAAKLVNDYDLDISYYENLSAAYTFKTNAQKLNK